MFSTGNTGPVCNNEKHFFIRLVNVNLEKDILDRKM